MMKVKLILSLDELEKAYKEYKKAFRFSGLFFGIHQEIMEDKDFEKYLYFSSDKVECYDIEKHKLFEIDYDDFYEVDLSLKQKVVCMLVTTRNQQYFFECKQDARFLQIIDLFEQKKVAHFLRLLDERIITQNKIIEKLQSLIKGIAQHCIKESTSGNTYVKLGDICQITTGKLDANAQVDNGIYPFFTCAEQPFKIDSFAFDTEALLISGNGANLGYINYYKGKFNAYQRTYVLDLFSENIQYIKWALKVLLPKRIAIEKSSSNTPYIVLSTLTDLRLPIPCKSKQSFIANLMQSLERKLSNQIAQYDSYNYLKQYLLRQMFI